MLWAILARFGVFGRPYQRALRTKQAPKRLRTRLGVSRGQPLEPRWALSGDPIVTIDTNFGDFQVELFPAAAPQTVANFLSYVTSGKYTDSFVSRAIPEFVIEGGGLTTSSSTYVGNSQFQSVPQGPAVPLEYNLPNTRGTLAMARRSSPNSATDEWFINLVDNSANLGPGGVDPNGYAVFGQVVGNGMQIVDQIAALPTKNEGSVSTSATSSTDLANLPLGPNNQLVEITSMTLDSIDGTVFADANGNGTLDQGETGIAGRTVFLNNDGTGQPDSSNPSTVTDANGNYSFAGLAPGTYSVDEVLPTGQMLTTLSHVVSVAADQTVSGVDFGEIAKPSIRGTVFNDVNANGKQDAGEAGLAGVTVFLDVDHTGVPDAANPSTVTDVNGTFTFSGLSAGTYTVRQVPPAPGATATTLPEVVNVVSGQTSVINFGDVLTSTILPLPISLPSAPISSNANVDFINSLYVGLLGHPADSAGVAYWQQQMSQGASRAFVAQGVWDSLEHRALEIDAFYLNYLDRPADDAGKAYWLTVFPLFGEKGVAAAFVTSREFLNRHASNADFVAALYDDIALRAPDNAGANYWTSQLNKGTSRSQVAFAFLNGQEATVRLVDELYSALLHRPADSLGQQEWSTAIEQNTLSVEDAGIGFLASDEYFNLVQ